MDQMLDQTAIWGTPDRCCQVCRYCAALAEPFALEDGAHIYGYCFKDGAKIYSPNMGKGWPIYLPLDSGATCDQFKVLRRKPDGH